MTPLDPPPLAEIRAAARRLRGVALRWPLVPLAVDDAPARISLKLENLQPVGSYKLRGAWNALAQVDRPALERGVVTASAGNMGQGVAWVARRLGVPCRIVAPDRAPRAKLEALERLGAHTVQVPFDEWWEVIETGRWQERDGYFLHPVADPRVVAGNGTIGLEILEDLPEVELVLVPYGGGGLSLGIASAVKALKPSVRVVACEIETAAPLTAARAAGRPCTIDVRPSFVDGVGGRSVIPAMWPAVDRMLDGTVVVSLEETAAAIRLLVSRHHVVAEGAGAVSVAAALSGQIEAEHAVCIVSGGHLDPAKLARILQGELP